MVIIGTSVIFFGTTLSMKTKIGALQAEALRRLLALVCHTERATIPVPHFLFLC